MISLKERIRDTKIIKASIYRLSTRQAKLVLAQLILNTWHRIQRPLKNQIGEDVSG